MPKKINWDINDELHLQDLVSGDKKLSNLVSGSSSAHHARHENGGADEVDVAGLSGELADDQPPKDHASDHVDGTDDIQSATAAQKGVATAAQITTLEKATLNDDTNIKTNGWVTDENDMTSDLDTKVPTEQSVKKFVEDSVLEESMVKTTLASDATPNPARTSKKTYYELTALSEAAVFAAPSGSIANGDQLFASVTDDGSAWGLTYNVIYDDPYTPDLPSTTTIGKTILMLFMYSSARTKWELTYTDEEA